MVSEKDLRVMRERTKDFEREAKKHREAQQAQEKNRRTSSKRTVARLMTLFF